MHNSSYSSLQISKEHLRFSHQTLRKRCIQGWIDIYLGFLTFVWATPAPSSSAKKSRKELKVSEQKSAFFLKFMEKKEYLVDQVLACRRQRCSRQRMSNESYLGTLLAGYHKDPSLEML